MVSLQAQPKLFLQHLIQHLHDLSGWILLNKTGAICRVVLFAPVNFSSTSKVGQSTGFVVTAGKPCQSWHQTLDKRKWLAHSLYQTRVFLRRSPRINFNKFNKLQVALMNTSSRHQTTSPWWVEVYMSASRQTYHLGPFQSQAEAKLSRSAHVEGLLQQATRDIVALIKQH